MQLIICREVVCLIYSQARWLRFYILIALSIWLSLITVFSLDTTLEVPLGPSWQRRRLINLSRTILILLLRTTTFISLVGVVITFTLLLKMHLATCQVNILHITWLARSCSRPFRWLLILLYSVTCVNLLNISHRSQRLRLTQLMVMVTTCLPWCIIDSHNIACTSWEQIIV